MPVATRTTLLVLLDHRIGRAKGISAKAIAAELDTVPRVVRELVTALRMEGVAVCGHPKTGYFIAATPEELQETLRFLRSRAMRSLKLESAMGGMPLADLIGQLHLPT